MAWGESLWQSMTHHHHGWGPIQNVAIAQVRKKSVSDVCILRLKLEPLAKEINKILG